MTNEQLQSTYEHGLALLQDGAYGQAKRIYQKLLCWIPATSAFYGLIGTANAQQGCHGAAALNFGRAAILDPVTEAVQFDSMLHRFLRQPVVIWKQLSRAKKS